MATINSIKPTPAGAVAAFTPSTPAGDVVPYLGGDLILEFVNGHTSAVTVNIVPTKPTTNVSGVGPVNVPTRSLALGQNQHGHHQHGLQRRTQVGDGDVERLRVLLVLRHLGCVGCLGQLSPPRASATACPRTRR